MRICSGNVLITAPKCKLGRVSCVNCDLNRKRVQPPIQPSIGHALPVGRSEILRQGISGATGLLSSQLLFPQGNSYAAESIAFYPTPQGQGQVGMRTLADSQLAVGRYPTFAYNALGGGGVATSTGDDGSDRISLSFDTSVLKIPAVTGKTASLLGIPIPPPFVIVVKPTKLEGFIDRQTGEAQLLFEAQFLFTATQAYQAPPLLVTTNLTTESVAGSFLGGTGSRLDSNGYARLVGVARVEPTTDAFLNAFLMLPTDVFALMSSQFIFPKA